MREPDKYRYFLGFQPDQDLRSWLVPLCDACGQFGGRVLPARLHLTLCVVAESRRRDHFIGRRVDAALSTQRLSSCPIRLGRVRGGEAGAAIFTIGRQEEIQAFYGQLLRCLARRQLSPLHRRSGLKPHVTLGYDPCRFDPFNVAREWIPGEILLIESEVGRTVHNVLGRWPLLDPPQGRLPFDEPPAIGVSLRAWR